MLETKAMHDVGGHEDNNGSERKKVFPERPASSLINADLTGHVGRRSILKVSKKEQLQKSRELSGLNRSTDKHADFIVHSEEEFSDQMIGEHKEQEDKPKTVPLKKKYSLSAMARSKLKRKKTKSERSGELTDSALALLPTNLHRKETKLRNRESNKQVKAAISQYTDMMDEGADEKDIKTLYYMYQADQVGSCNFDIHLLFSDFLCVPTLKAEKIQLKDMEVWDVREEGWKDHIVIMGFLGGVNHLVMGLREAHLQRYLVSRVIIV